MNKIITKEQIEAVLQVVYNTNISAQQFDALKKLFIDLPDVKEEKNEENKTTK